MSADTAELLGTQLAGQADLYLIESGASGQAEVVKVFRADGALVRELSTGFGLSHPNLLSCLGPIRLDGNRTGLRYPYIPGGSLRDALADGPLAEEVVVDLVRQVLDGLEALHDAGFVHADIKPDNLLRDEDGTWIIADFGCTISLRQARDAVRVPGTPAYVSPERLCEPFDGRSDLYALGMVAFEALTGDHPFTGNPREILSAQLNEPVPVSGLSSPVLAGWIGRVTQKSPADRPIDARDARGLLDALEFGHTEPGCLPRVHTPSVSSAPTRVSHAAQLAATDVSIVGVLDSDPAVVIVDDGSFLIALDSESGRRVARPILHDGRFASVHGTSVLTVIHGDLTLWNPMQTVRTTPLVRGLRRATAAAVHGQSVAFVDARGLSIRETPGQPIEEHPWPHYTVSPCLAWTPSGLMATGGALGDQLHLLGSSTPPIALDGPALDLHPSGTAVTLSIARRDALCAWFIGETTHSISMPLGVHLAAAMASGVVGLHHNGGLWWVDATGGPARRLGTAATTGALACSTEWLATQSDTHIDLWRLHA